jgi:hypothetical protein
MLAIRPKDDRKRQRTVNGAISILVCRLNHLVDLLVCQVLAKRGQYVAQLGGGDGAAVVPVKDLEGLAKLLLGVAGLDLVRHHGEEF